MVYLKTLLQGYAIGSLLTSTTLANPVPDPSRAATVESRQAIGTYPVPNSNNYKCRSLVHTNPVIFLHGLPGNQNIDLNVLQTNLSNSGYCTYALTYGEQPLLPGIGGLKSAKSSSKQIADFIKNVKTRTGAARVDLVGHSEGGFMALYVPKVEGLAPIIDKIVAIAPPTHGTNFTLKAYHLVYAGGPLTANLARKILETGRCEACGDIFGYNAPAVGRLNDGTPIRQNGNNITVIITRNDEIVTPVSAAEVNEPNVPNIYLQDECPHDHAGHLGMVYDTYVWGLVRRALSPGMPLYPCTVGIPV